MGIEHASTDEKFKLLISLIIRETTNIYSISTRHDDLQSRNLLYSHMNDKTNLTRAPRWQNPFTNFNQNSIAKWAFDSSSHTNIYYKLIFIIRIKAFQTIEHHVETIDKILFPFSLDIFLSIYDKKIINKTSNLSIIK